MHIVDKWHQKVNQCVESAHAASPINRVVIDSSPASPMLDTGLHECSSKRDGLASCPSCSFIANMPTSEEAMREFAHVNSGGKEGIRVEGGPRDPSARPIFPPPTAEVLSQGNPGKPGHRDIGRGSYHHKNSIY